MAGSASINDVFGAFASPKPKAAPSPGGSFGSPTGAHSKSFAQRVVVGVGDMAVSNVEHVTLSTFALGSCVGVIVFDPVARAGGLLHLMLPDSTLSPDRAGKKPAMFADTGIPMLFNALRGIRAERQRVNILLAGGACVLNGPDQFKIGERNIATTRKLLSLYGLRASYEELGGNVNRTVHLNIATGEVFLKLPGREIRHRLG
ncbi:chemotaxis protein CheD [Actomonas aquatica]|uniref:Probable chemoreceptor glutamine deamidase CheD n=1 Tax=Actomonas aquatica TaxID=2866162 RepID=A0ABZ1CCA3_9BACT|nr:chemotaxis protein CheD [Opitutus sp. WL0086]WRQ89290.1 chemotaxis protein CheD [Opitutus sp. WL0086]